MQPRTGMLDQVEMAAICQNKPNGFGRGHRVSRFSVSKSWVTSRGCPGTAPTPQAVASSTRKGSLKAFCVAEQAVVDFQYDCRLAAVVVHHVAAADTDALGALIEQPIRRVSAQPVSKHSMTNGFWTVRKHAHSLVAIAAASSGVDATTGGIVIPEGAGRCQGRFELFRPRCGQR